MKYINWVDKFLLIEKVDEFGFLMIILWLGFHRINFYQNYVPWLVCDIDKLDLDFVVW
jgi:hypothetical protein